MALVREDLSLQPVLNMCVCTARKTEGSVTATRHVASGLLPRPTTGAGSSNSRLAAAGSRGATLPQVQLPKNAPLAHRFYLLTSLLRLRQRPFGCFPSRLRVRELIFRLLEGLFSRLLGTFQLAEPIYRLLDRPLERRFFRGKLL